MCHPGILQQSSIGTRNHSAVKFHVNYFLLCCLMMLCMHRPVYPNLGIPCGSLRVTAAARQGIPLVTSHDRCFCACVDHPKPNPDDSNPRSLRVQKHSRSTQDTDSPTAAVQHQQTSHRLACTHIHTPEVLYVREHLCLPRQLGISKPTTFVFLFVQYFFRSSDFSGGVFFCCALVPGTLALDLLTLNL